MRLPIQKLSFAYHGLSTFVIKQAIERDFGHHPDILRDLMDEVEDVEQHMFDIHDSSTSMVWMLQIMKDSTGNNTVYRIDGFVQTTWVHCAGITDESRLFSYDGAYTAYPKKSWLQKLKDWGNEI